MRGEQLAGELVRKLVRGEESVAQTFRFIVRELDVDRVGLQFILTRSFDLSHRARNAYHDWFIGQLSDRAMKEVLEFQLISERLK